MAKKPQERMVPDYCADLKTPILIEPGLNEEQFIARYTEERARKLDLLLQHYGYDDMDDPQQILDFLRDIIDDHVPGLQVDLPRAIPKVGATQVRRSSPEAVEHFVKVRELHDTGKYPSARAAVRSLLAGRVTEDQLKSAYTKYQLIKRENPVARGLLLLADDMGMSVTDLIARYRPGYERMLSGLVEVHNKYKKKRNSPK